MSDYTVYEGKLIPADEFMHYAKGQTKKNAKYVSRKLVNGKWVYSYEKGGISRGNGQPVDMTNATPRSQDVSERQRFAQNEAKTRFSISNRRAQQIQSEAESMKRKQVSAQRNIESSLSYRFRTKKAYYTNKAKNFLKKFTVPLRYGSKVTTDIAVTKTKNGEIAFGKKGQYYDTKQQKYVNLGKGFIKKYGL